MAELSILHVNTERTWRGGERQTFLLARELARRGHRVRLACRPGAPLARRAAAAGLPLLPLPARGEVDPRAVWRLWRHLRKVHYDLVHLHTSHAHTLGVLAARLRGGVRTVVHRRVDFSIHRTPLRLNWFKYRWGVDRYIAISRAVRAQLVRDGVPPERIRVVRSGVDLEGLVAARARGPAVRRALGLSPETPLVGCVGHLTWHKGQAVLLRAVPRLAAWVPAVQVVVAGEGEDRPRLEALARELGAAERVRFLGFQADVAGLLAALDVLAAPSRMEGLNTTVLEAQALRVPVVASRVGGLVEAVAAGETGLLVPPEDPEALARALAGLLRDPARRRALGARGPAWVESRFSLSAMVRGVEAVYEEVLDRKGPP